MLTYGQIEKFNPYTIESDAGMVFGRYGARKPVAMRLKVSKAIVRGKNPWRRVYTDGRFYIWVDGAAVYLDSEASEAVLQNMQDDA